MNMLNAAASGQRIDYIYAQSANAIELTSTSLTKSSRLDCDSFIAGACEFFATQAKQTASVGTPYVAQEKTSPLEFTATIRVTGSRRGAVYVTASRAMLTIMLMRMGATDITTATMCNVLRELAAKMVAVSRRDNRSDVLIWDPTISTDRTGQIDIGRNASPLIVPIHWRKFTA